MTNKIQNAYDTFVVSNDNRYNTHPRKTFECGYKAALADFEKALGVCEQALLEVQSAQERGARWYTQGDRGLFMQVRMWVSKGLDAIKEARSTV